MRIKNINDRTPILICKTLIKPGMIVDIKDKDFENFKSSKAGEYYAKNFLEVVADEPRTKRTYTKRKVKDVE